MNLNSKIKSVLIYLSIAYGIVSCKQKPHYAYPVKEFDPNSISEYVVNGTKTDIIINGPIWQTVMDDSLLVVQVNEPTGLLSVYNTRNMSWMMGLCTIGRARNEFIKPFFLLSQTYKRGEETFITAVDKDLYVKEINLTASIRDGFTVVSNIGDCPSFNHNNRFLFVDNDITNLFLYKIGSDTPEDDFCGAYSVINSKTKEKKVIEAFPKPMNSDAESVSFYSSGAIYKHPERNLFVQPLEYMDYILYFDIDADSAFAVHKNGSPTFDDIAPDGRTLLFAGGGTVTKDYLFTRHCEYHIDDNGKHIRVTNMLIFDWQGNLKKNIKLSPDVINLTYDERTQILYGFDMPEEGFEQTLYTFNMSDVFKTLP
ncbi:MAG TPA: hypothetical protein VFC94_03785 [Bacteroidaceae bacterium]|nr:hypothetical protein [Bacteroidaceae bacterium]